MPKRKTMKRPVYSRRRVRPKTGKMAVKRLTQRVKALENDTEYKVSYYSASQILDTSWSVNNSMAPRALQGSEGQADINTADNIRIGDKVNLRYWVMEGIVELPKVTNLVASDALVQCRILIADNLDGDTGLTQVDILQDATTVPRALVSPWKNSVSGGKKYKIYKDMKFALTGNKGYHRFKFKLPIKKTGRVLEFDQNASGDPSNFNVSLVGFADVAPLGALRPTLSYTVQARFTDS
ncbi:MAG: putative capsid protein [Circoviridae sp.]|nr:MAG: putative capsid protein [Circoviridae sp.]